MADSADYRFHVHRDLPAWRLVIDGRAPWPPQAVAEHWLFTRARTAADTNPDVLRLVEQAGFCLFKIGGTFEEVEAERLRAGAEPDRDN